MPLGKLEQARMAMAMQMQMQQQQQQQQQQQSQLVNQQRAVMVQPAAIQMQMQQVQRQLQQQQVKAPTPLLPMGSAELAVRAAAVAAGPPLAGFNARQQQNMVGSDSEDPLQDPDVASLMDRRAAARAAKNWAAADDILSEIRSRGLQCEDVVGYMSGDPGGPTRVYRPGGATVTAVLRSVGMIGEANNGPPAAGKFPGGGRNPVAPASNFEGFMQTNSLAARTGLCMTGRCARHRCLCGPPPEPVPVPVSMQVPETETEAEREERENAEEKERLEVEERLAKERLEEKWVYLDNDDNQHGPFSLEEMQGWYRAGYLPLNHRVKREREAEFLSLHTMLEITTDRTAETVRTVRHHIACASYASALDRCSCPRVGCFRCAAVPTGLSAPSAAVHGNAGCDGRNGSGSGRSVWSLRGRVPGGERRARRGQSPRAVLTTRVCVLIYCATAFVQPSASFLACSQSSLACGHNRLEPSSPLRRGRRASGGRACCPPSARRRPPGRAGAARGSCALGWGRPGTRSP
jgi:hypothetical protein